MKIRVLGGGVYGCHIALALLRDGHEVELHEIRDRLFAGASGGIPARLHQGFHYPRSYLTRAACRDHNVEFMAHYGHFTRGVPINLYAIASGESLVDFGTYRQLMQAEVPCIVVHDPSEFGLDNVEGALLTGERHIVTDRLRDYFYTALGGDVRFGMSPGEVDSNEWDLTVDCTFCANDAENIDRFEPCLTVLLLGPTNKAVTIMDGPFGSLYPWNEQQCLSSLTSASLTPISKTCKTWQEAQSVLNSQTSNSLEARAQAMIDQMAGFWPAMRDMYEVASYRLSVRAMPRSAADTRLVDVIPVGERALRVRAGKIDAVFHAERIVKDKITAMEGAMK